jgi:hypothetical protein
MKPKPNWSEIEERIDFNSVSQKLTQFATSGAGRRKTVIDLLDKVKDALLEARSNGASYRALAAFLNESGLPVSEPTLRQYLREHGAQKRRQKARSVAKPKAEPAQPRQPARKPAVAPPRASTAQRSDHESGGPRIADINNL